MDIKWVYTSFENLTVEQLYQILSLRTKVFIVEQNSIYQDEDQKDQKAIHLQGFNDEKLVAYCRLFRAGDYFQQASIGRVVVDTDYRKIGLGHQLLDMAIGLQKKLFNEVNITISAQLRLKQFYENHGFKQISEVYLEDNIPHIRMIRTII